MSVARALGWMAFVLGAAAAFAGNPYRGSPALSGLADRSENASAALPSVAALKLAEWIRHREPGLRVIDLRTADAFDAFRIPGAKREDPQALDRLAVSNGDVLVLVSADGRLSARTVERVRASGADEIYVLRDGVRGWLDGVLNPVLPADASPAAREGFAAQAELSRYFGGQPRVGAATSTSESEPTLTENDLDARIANQRRRGCG